MKKEPLFINFVNKKISIIEIISIVLENAKDAESISIAESYRDNNNYSDLSQFRKDFSELLEDVIDNGVSQRIINYLNSYMKPSLLEYVDSSSGSRAGEIRFIAIKDAESPWVEAIICYNLCIFIKAYGFSDIKNCPVCLKFFTNKGKYAKYCSESCKSQKA